MQTIIEDGLLTTEVLEAYLIRAAKAARVLKECGARVKFLKIGDRGVKFVIGDHGHKLRGEPVRFAESRRGAHQTMVAMVEGARVEWEAV